MRGGQNLPPLPGRGLKDIIAKNIMITSYNDLRGFFSGSINIETEYPCPDPIRDAILVDRQSAKRETTFNSHGHSAEGAKREMVVTDQDVDW